ncbi:MAG: MFS transporter [Candidatus Binatia bacterium]
MSSLSPDDSGSNRSIAPFASLRCRDFRLFWVALVISNIGTWMQMTASSWLLYELTNSPFQLGLNGVFRAFPTISLGLFGGALVDRYERKWILLFAQMGLMLLAFILAILDQTGLIEVWHIYTVTIFGGILGTVESPARQALLPSLVPRRLLPNAIALNSLLWKGTVVLGPALAGVLIAVVGTAGAFFTNGVSFLAVVIALFLIHASSPGTGGKDDIFKDIRKGLRYVSTQKTILGVMVMEATSALFGLDSAMLTIFARDILQIGPSGLGFLQSARGLGAIVGSALLVSAISRVRVQGRVLVVSAILYGTSFALFGLSTYVPLSLFLMALVGAADVVWGATRNTVLQLKSPDAMRGRVMGIFHLTSRGLHPLGQTRTGMVVPLMGAGGTAFFGGVMVAAVALLTVWRTPSVSLFSIEDEKTDHHAPQPRDLSAESISELGGPPRV